MRKSKLALLVAATLFAITALSAMVYAHDSGDSSGSMMGDGMMGGGMMGGGMMGRGMMRGGMMGHCGGMMSRGRPNDQWRKNTPSTPDNE